MNIIEDQSLQDINIFDDKINFYNARVYRRNIGFFNIKEGNLISFARENLKVSDEDISRSIINSIFGYLLYQRENFVLHASAIKLKNNSFLFMGKSGSGKSSLAAELELNYDANFLCEDVALILRNNNSYSIKKAPPFVKLSDKMANHLKIDDKNKLMLSSDRLNRCLYKMNTHDSFNELNACFFLEWGNDFSIQRLDENKILPAFLLNTFSAYPYNSCKKSTKDFHLFIQDFIKDVPIFNIIRNKDGLSTNTRYIYSFLSNLIN